MAATDMNAVVHIMDANGNVNNIFPATKIANVDGLQSALNAKADSTTVTNQLSGKVDKVTGKGLSTNDYTTAEKNKLSGIADGATANIGTVTSVKVGNTAYNPSSGVVSLPAYPTDTNTHRPIQVNGTQILGDNTTPLNLKAGSNVSILNSDGTVTIAATDTTYSAATQSANGLMSSSDKTKLDGIDSSSSTFSISRYSASYTVDTTTWKFNGMAWFTILITNSSQINANTSVIPAYVPSDLKPKGSRDINLVCDVDNKYCRAWITGGSQYIYLRPTEIIPANSNIRITGCYPY